MEYKDAYFRAGYIENNKKVPNDVIYFETVRKDKRKTKNDFRLDCTINEALAFQLVLSGTLWAYDTIQRYGEKHPKKRGVNIGGK